MPLRSTTVSFSDLAASGANRSAVLFVNESGSFLRWLERRACRVVNISRRCSAIDAVFVLWAREIGCRKFLPHVVGPLSLSRGHTAAVCLPVGWFPVLDAEPVPMFCRPGTMGPSTTVRRQPGHEFIRTCSIFPFRNRPLLSHWRHTGRDAPKWHKPVIASCPHAFHPSDDSRSSGALSTFKALRRATS